MNKGGAPQGNKNGSKNKLWSDAIRRELSGKVNEKKLKKLAKSLIKEAEQGNMQAMKEMGDRIEGKPAQAMEVSGPDGGAIPINFTTDDESIL